MRICQLFTDAVDFFYPTHCISCHSIVSSKDVFCLYCATKCKATDHFKIQNNETKARTLLRVDVRWSAALFTYVKHGHVQKAIHMIKYGGRKDIAIKWGKLFGENYLSAVGRELADVIIPIPVHYKRRRKRGYNQSEVFAKGISLITGIKIINNLLVKQSNQITLTQQSRESRFLQVRESFALSKKNSLQGKIVLLVDDVLTTGATIEAAVEKLNGSGCKEIDLGFIALAKN